MELILELMDFVPHDMCMRSTVPKNNPKQARTITSRDNYMH